MEGGSSSDNTTNNPNTNPSRNNGKAPATPSPPPPTAPSSSNQNATPRSSGLPPTPPSSFTYREQDRYMPIANVVRIMRRALPPHAKISDEAKETVQECVSEFISFVTEEANERCRKEHRKTVTGEDLLWAIGRLGFDDYLEPLKIYLKRCRESEAVGLGKSEMASRQRRHANRAAGVQIQGSSASHQPLARIGAGVMPNPTLMPPLPTMVNPQHQSGMISPLRNPGYFNDGSNPNPNPNLNPSPNAGFNSVAAVGGEHGPNPNPNLTPGARFNLRGGSSDGLGGFDMLSPTPSADSESDMSFFDLLNQFK